MKRPESVDEILAIIDQPVVAIDQNGKFYFINDNFTETYGWTKDDLLGKMVTEIIPENLRNAHTIGFARFLSTEQPKVAGQALPLKIQFKDGRVLDAEHFILGDKKDGVWQFAATITKR